MVRKWLCGTPSDTVWLAVGLFIAYLGSSLLLARMSAEAAKVRYESHLLWTNKLDRCGNPSPNVSSCSDLHLFGKGAATSPFLQLVCYLCQFHTTGTADAMSAVTLGTYLCEAALYADS